MIFNIVIVHWSDLKPKVIYNRTRSRWRISDEKIKKIKWVLSVVDGRVIGVWEPKTWNTIYDERTKHMRKEFEGEKAPQDIFDKFFNRNLVSIITGKQNPIKYYTEAQILKCPKIGD